MRAKERNAFYGTSILFFATTLWLGGVTRWSILTMGVAAAAISLLTLRSRRVFKTPPIPVILFAAMSLFSLLQLMPLPIGLVAMLNPDKVSVLNETARLLGNTPPWFANLTLDTPATLLELIKTLSYALLTLSALRIGQSPKGRLLLTKLCVALGTTVLTVAFAHWALKLDHLYGFYLPESNLFGTLSPLLNSNHLAAYLGSIACVTIAYSLTSKGPLKALGVALTCSLIAMSLYQRSRSATLSLAIGLVLTLLFSLKTRPKKRSTKKSWHSIFWLVAFVSCVSVLCAFLFDPLYSQFNNGTTAELLGDKAGKFSLWRDSESLLWAHPLVGVGRGAFESAFTPFISEGTIQRFSHVENAPLQALIDWGWLMGGLVLILFLNVIKSSWKNATQSPLHAGAFGGLSVLVVQSAGDFSFHLPAVVMLFILYLSILGDNKLKVAKGTFASKRKLSLLINAAIPAALILSALPFGRLLREDQTNLSSIELGSKAAIDYGLKALKRHPGDFLIAGHLAESHLGFAPKTALKFTNYSIRRNNNYSRSHQLAAMLLLKTTNKRQACLEYKSAMRLAPIGVLFLDQMLNAFSQQDLLTCLPTQGTLAIQIFDSLRVKRPKLSFEYAQELTKRTPENEKVWQRLARISRDLGKTNTEKGALLAAYNLKSSNSNLIALCKNFITTKNFDDAKSLLEENLSLPNSPSDRTNIYLLLATIEIEKKQYPPARKFLELAMTSSFQSAALKRAVFLKKALLEKRSGNANRAEWEQKQADLIRLNSSD